MIWVHALRNALIPVITVVGLEFGALLGGAVAIEAVFHRQGLGMRLVEAINARDYPVVQGLGLASRRRLRRCEPPGGYPLHLR